VTHTTRSRLRLTRQLSNRVGRETRLAPAEKYIERTHLSVVSGRPRVPYIAIVIIDVRTL